MPRERLPMRKIHDVLRLHADGLSKRLCLPFISSGVHQERRPVRRHW